MLDSSFLFKLYLFCYQYFFPALLISPHRCTVYYATYETTAWYRCPVGNLLSKLDEFTYYNYRYLYGYRCQSDWADHIALWLQNSLIPVLPPPPPHPLSHRHPQLLVQLCKTDSASFTFKLSWVICFCGEKLFQIFILLFFFRCGVVFCPILTVTQVYWYLVADLIAAAWAADAAEVTRAVLQVLL